MTQDAEARVWQALEALRGGPRPIGVDTLCDELERLDVRVSSTFLVDLMRHWAPRSTDVLVVPTHVSAFVAAIAVQRARDRVVDPWCNLGQLASEVARRLPNARVTGINPRADVLRLLAYVEDRVEWCAGRVDVHPELLGSSNDLVVCAPPFNAPATVDGSRSGKGDLATTLLELGCGSLSASGEALFVLAAGAWARGDGGWRDRLCASGIAVKACYWLPSGTFAPHTMIASMLVHLSREKQRSMFVAEVPQDEDGISLVFDNLTNQRNAPDVRLGRWLPITSFRSLPQLRALERTELLGVRFGAGRRLGDIATVRTWRPDQNEANVVLAVVNHLPDGNSGRQLV